MDSDILIRGGVTVMGGLLLWGVKEINDRGKRRDEEKQAATDKALAALGASTHAFQERCLEFDEARRKRLHDLSDMIASIGTRVSVLETVLSERKKP